MRATSKLLMLVVALVSAMSAGATMAQAQNHGIELIDEETGNHCPAVTEVTSGHTASGGCHLNVTGSSIDLIGHVLGMESELLNNCLVSFELRLNESGEGYAVDIIVVRAPGDRTSSTGCANVRACNSEAGETHFGTHGDSNSNVWDAELAEKPNEPLPEPTNGPLRLEIWTCLMTGTALGECEGAVELGVTEILHGFFAASTDTTESNSTGDDDASIPMAMQDSMSMHCEVEGGFTLLDEPDHETHAVHL